MTSSDKLKNCWEAAWDTFPEVPRSVDHNPDFVADVYPDMEKEQKTEMPEPFNTIVQQTNYADASVFEAFPDCTMFDRPMIIGETWPKEPQGINAVRVLLLGPGLRTRLFFYNPELE